MRDFRELKVWQKAHQVALDVYRHSKGFPADERFGLTAHLRKSATSVPSNIAEGCGRGGDKELARFLSIALDLQASSTISCCSLTTSSTCRATLMLSLPNKSPRSGACCTVSCSR